MRAAIFVFLGLLPALAAAESYEPFAKLLQDHLIEKTLPGNGLVTAFDYQAALEDPQTTTRLTAQRNALANFDPSSLDGREESIAFWINAYNFFMLDQILTQRPDGELVGSVWDYGGRINPFVDSVFDRKNFTIGGRQYSLNEIEKDILLGDDYQARGWKDARVHFAVNCASVGCPPLRRQVYTANNVEPLLTENTRRAFNTDRHLKVEGDTVHVTELFKWYEQDFTEAAGTRFDYIRRWATPEIARQISDSATLEFIDYDWSLNRPDNFPNVEF
ncbi:DUF547 domain-containing protein [Marinobacter sp. CHS3-4]|uniref:DUF547 domain-containing protein n=1 Tax=Marinobacter sp. CHS3-4 TaxID=3045174 RepID=UPI0024B5B967|nr:DUF547 domain-containing protein [Marinobacter sp. CHS3-4]MDI9243683.1 DUF547 domain-containing protein [Marinobacter sp. CHS3-4]